MAGSGLSARATDESVEALLDAFAQSVGGETALDAVERVEYRGHIIMADGLDPAPIIVRVEKPNRLWIRIVLPAGETLSLFDGERAWFRTLLPDDPGAWEPMEPAESIELRNRAYETAALSHRPELPGREVKLAAPGTLAIHYDEGEPRERIYEAGRLIQETTVEGESRFFDYREFGGIAFPTRIVTQSPFGAVTTQFDEVQVNPEFPADTFRAEPLGEPSTLGGATP